MDEGDIQRIRHEVHDIIEDQIDANRSYYTRLLDQARDRDERLLDILNEQNKVQAAQAEYMKSLDKKMTERTKARDRTIYALLALLAGVLYAAGLFQPVEIPLVATALVATVEVTGRT